MSEFTAKTVSSFDILRQPSVGFYVPAYQREYSWEAGKIRRLYADAAHGLCTFIERDEHATAFLGTIIVHDDPRYQTVDPKVQGDLPKSVQVVIDGQQRLATILFSNIALHEFLSKAARRLSASTDESDTWLYEQILTTQADLQKTFQQDMVHGDGAFKFYPRMIRAYTDSWSRKEEKARYQSPVAAYLRAYSIHTQDPNARAFSYRAPAGSEEEAKKHAMADAAIKKIRQQRTLVAKGGDETVNMEMPALSKIAANKEGQEALLRAPMPDLVKARVLREEADDPESDYCQAVRILFFSRFWLDRVAVVYVTAKSEDYAFDIFDALNTTGEPLTAFETFRPEVMKTETLAKYESSPSRTYMREIENVLDAHTKAEDKRKATDEVLLPFALAETGTKLSKRLNEQRVYLRREYAKLDGPEEKRGFVSHLADAATFVRSAWVGSRGSEPALTWDTGMEKDLVTMCLEVLRRANHQIVTAPLLRFYSAIRQAGDTTARESAIASFEQAVKAVTAFFAFWRGSRHGTKNIDSHYRRLMREGFAGAEDFAAVPPFSRQRGRGFPDVNDLRRALRRLLAAAAEDSKADPPIVQKDDWVRLAKSIPVYDISMPLARLLLFAASHDVIPDPQHPGLVVVAKSGSAPMLTSSRWMSDLTVEHVWPQSRPRQNWDSSLHSAEPELVHRLGNLALIPTSENSSLGDGSWHLKRLAFRVLASESKQELDSQLAEAEKQGLQVPGGLEKILSEGKYLPHLKTVAAMNDDWTAQVLESRSVQMAGLVWDRLSPWLGY